MRITRITAITIALNVLSAQAENQHVLDNNLSPQVSIMSIVKVSGDKYLLSEKPVASFPRLVESTNSTFCDHGNQQPTADDGAADIKPIAILSGPQDFKITAEWLAEKIDWMSSSDDVISPNFFNTIVLKAPTKMQRIGKKEVALLARIGVEEIHFLAVSEHYIPDGPYFMKHGRIYEAMKLFLDAYGAFMYGVVSDGADGFNRVFSDHIPVPSRLYSLSKNASRPLAGKRIAIKDIIDLKGLETSASNKAYAIFHGPANRTAPAIQKLIDLGAVVIGKTKTTQFASGETARDWIEFQCPFNPRADGYLDPAGSSTGSASAVAGYDWVDYSVGTDTCGSVIWPAALQGVFGLRPSIGSQDLRGVMPASSLMDTMGFFSRDIREFETLQRLWYGQTHSVAFKKKISRIIVPKGILEPLPSSKRSVMQIFIDDMVNSTGLPRIDLDISKIWNGTANSNDNITYQDYLYSTVAHIQIWDCHVHESRFFEAYRDKFGVRPYLNPMILHKWDIRSKISTGEYKEALERQKTFKSFLESHIFNDSAIMILPAGGITTSYRDDPLPPESIDVYLQSFGFDNTFYSILGGLPSVVVPVGQRRIESKITGKEVLEPVSMMITGPAGSESSIINLIRTVLENSGRPLTVKTGSDTY